jgi:hypothetical protein
MALMSTDTRKGGLLFFMDGDIQQIQYIWIKKKKKQGSCIHITLMGWLAFG